MLRKAARFFKSQPMYDARPWICMIVGLMALASSKHQPIAMISSVVLVGCAASIFYLRKVSRREPVRYNGRR